MKLMIKFTGGRRTGDNRHTDALPVSKMPLTDLLVPFQSTKCDKVPACVD